MRKQDSGRPTQRHFDAQMTAREGDRDGIGADHVNSNGGDEWLDRVATTRNIALVGLAFTFVQILESASLWWVGIGAVSAFGLASWLAYRRGKRGIAVALALGIAVPAAVVLRVYSTPSTETFLYDGSLASLPVASARSAFANQNGIPLTNEPNEGLVIRTVDIGEPAAFDVTCVVNGVFDRGNTPVDWAYISRGNYQTLWIPLAYLYGLSYGKANTLLPCSDWRWELHDFGNPAWS